MNWIKGKRWKNFYFWSSAIVIIIIGISLVLTVESDKQQEWIGFWGNIFGGIIGGIVAFAGVKYTIDSQGKSEANKLMSCYKEVYEALEESLINIDNVRNRYPTDKRLVEINLRQAKNRYCARFEKYEAMLSVLEPYIYGRFSKIDKTIADTVDKIESLITDDMIESPRILGLIGKVYTDVTKEKEKLDIYYQNNFTR